MWDRGKDKPLWPTFRKALLGGASIDRLQSMSKLICFAEGTHGIHIANGRMVSYGGEVVQFPCVSFELQMSVARLRDDRKTNLYLLCWLGAYPNGVIPHFGPQWPHVEKFHPWSVEREAKLMYRQIAHYLYGKDALDSEVSSFVSQIDREAQL